MTSHRSLALTPSIKRGMARSQDARADVADAALKARRPAVLARYRNTCAACGYVARQTAHLDVHHLDNDHHNNDEDNLVAACHTCHAYQHIGELSTRSDQWAQGLGKRSGLAWIPELQAQDLNLLMRAIGAALMDERSREDAQAVYEEILQRTELTQQRFGAWKALDFAAGMQQLSAQDYAQRAEVLKDERLVFSEQVLQALGREFVTDYPSLPVSTWARVAQSVVGAGDKGVGDAVAR